MTLNEFYKKLKKTNFKWTCSGEWKPGKCVFIRSHFEGFERPVCPVMAVYHSEFNIMPHIVTIGCFRDLGLSEKDGYKIMDGADGFDREIHDKLKEVLELV